MTFSTRDKALLGVGLVIVIVAVVMQLSGNLMQSTSSPPDDNTAEGVKLTLLTNAGVMIEANGTRIYIDPVDLPSEYGDSPADAILITHEHGDHYQQSTIRMLQKEGTVNVFPEIMEDEIERHVGTGVVPGDEVTVGTITITTFYMYTYSPTGTDPATHPAESNYTSYIVDVDGFTVFHAGDSKNIPEYEELTGTIDVALLPLGPGCQTMADTEIVDAIRAIEPGHFIPIHFTGRTNDQFVRRYRTMIESGTECEICNLDHYTSHTF
jgi:L-ascorbate metabolism protein UlaG (beta-lactamase superfamily)